MTRPVRVVQPDAQVVPRSAPSLRRRIRRAFPLADGVTYAIAAGSLTAVWIVAELLEVFGTHLAGVP